VLPKFEQRLVERLLARFYDRRMLAHVQHRTRLSHTIRGNSITLFKIRAGSRSQVAQFRYSSVTSLWSLYWRDRDRQWRPCEDMTATRNFGTLLTEVDRDPASIFWG